LIKQIEAQGQFSDSSLSFVEMEACKKVFRIMMHSVHHLRVEYPE